MNATAPAGQILDRLMCALEQLRNGALELEHAFAGELDRVEPNRRDGARNLVHYLSLRRHDIRELQMHLSALGLSSLGRLEAHTLATIEAVMGLLYRLAGRGEHDLPQSQAPVSFRAGAELLACHAQQLLGPPSAERTVRIMVTAPSAAASDELLVRRLLEAGMDVMRINCAHDGPAEWAAMVLNLRNAEQALGRRCRILADLGGPKLRTGQIRSAAQVVKIRPQRGSRGEVLRPSRVRLTPAEGPQLSPAGCDAALPVAGAVLAACAPGDRIRVDDCRGKRRFLDIVEIAGNSRIAHAYQTIYVEEGAMVGPGRKNRPAVEGFVRGLPGLPETIRLYSGDPLILTRGEQPGHAATRGTDGSISVPARIPCTLDAVFLRVQPGQHIWFDDGRLGGVIEQGSDDEIFVRITHAPPRGARLPEGRGINLPDTCLETPAMTPRDELDLATVAEFADMIGLSFVRRPEDIHLLEDRLQALGQGHLGIVLKIENRTAFERLPQLLLAGLRSPPVGVMVARGDLAVEVGFERLAEVQEEILWMCEAAHVPVIWATQVLEKLTKSGIPSRAEVTDAAMSARAECVMLNKGPYIVEAVDFLHGVLERMQRHQSKKTSMLRQLAISRARQGA